MSEKLLLSFRNIKANFAFTATGALAGAVPVPFAQLGGLALRSFPVERLVQTLQIVIGSSSVSFPISDIMEGTALASYDMNEFASTAGSFERPLEHIGSCMGATIINQGGGAATIAQALCAQTSSATGAFITSGVPGSVPKGGSLNIEAVTCAAANTIFNNGSFVVGGQITPATPVQVQFSMSGYLKAPIFQWLSKECRESLSCVSQVQINMILNPAKTIFSYLEPQYVPGAVAGAGGLNGLALQSVDFDPNSFVSSAITLSVRYITPPPNYSMKDVVRGYYAIDRYITTYGSPSGAVAIAPQTTINALLSNQTSISSNSFTLPVVPRFLALYVKPARNYYYSSINSLQVSNFYLPITQVSLTLANRTAQLSTAPVEHLYSLSVESGLRMPFSQWRGYGGILGSNNVVTTNVFTNSANEAVASTAQTALQYEPYSGGILLLDLSTCLGLSEELCIGRNVPVNMQVTVNCINPSGLTINQAELFVLSISNSYLEIDHMNGNSVVISGGVSASEALQVASMDLGEIDNHHQTKYAGGFSFGDIVSKVKNILPGVKNVAKAVASGLENMGYGVSGGGVMGAGAQDKKMAAVMKKMKQMAM
jgi:hypothetical protein